MERLFWKYTFYYDVYGAYIKLIFASSQCDQIVTKINHIKLYLTVL